VFTVRWFLNLDAAVSVVFETLTASTSEPAYVGLQVRDSRYLFISSHGHYGIVSRPLSVDIERSGMWDIPWQRGAAFVRGVGEINRLRAMMKGSASAFFINEQLVGTMELPLGIANIGWISVVAGSSGQECSILLDNMELRDPIVQAPFTGAPVYLQVHVTNALTGESSAPSGEAQWTYDLQTPEQWALAPDLNERVLKVTRRLYEDFNRQGQAHGDNAQYMLQGGRGAHSECRPGSTATLNAPRQDALHPAARRDCRGVSMIQLKPTSKVLRPRR
jgi:hypothetical protein